MAKTGYIKLHRSFLEHWLYDDGKEPFDKAHAWLDLLLLANYEETKRMYKGQLQITGAGQMQVSDRYLADRWHWSKDKVRRYTKMLEIDGMITTKRTTNNTTITIENWGKFQVQRTTNNTTDKTTGKPTGDTHNKNIKNIKKGSIFKDAEGFSYMVKADGSIDRYRGKQ